MERIKLKVDLNKLVKGFPVINLLAEYEPREIREIYGIKHLKIKIKNKDHHKILDSRLKESIEVDFFRGGKTFKAWLRKENQHFYLTEVNFYEVKGKSTISVYNGHKRRLLTTDVSVNVVGKKYILISDYLKALPDNNYFIVFKKSFYKCIKSYDKIYFTYRERIKS